MIGCNRDFNWEACSRFLMVCTDIRLPWPPRWRICRLRAVMRWFIKVARRMERTTLCLWRYVVSHFLAYPSRHVYRCIGAAVWTWYADWHRRVLQHPVASIQPLNGLWLLPDPHWTTSPSLLTNMLKFRSTPRTWVQSCTIWLTVSCGSQLALRDFGKFLLDPTPLLWPVLIPEREPCKHNIPNFCCWVYVACWTTNTGTASH